MLRGAPSGGMKVWLVFIVKFFTLCSLSAIFTKDDFKSKKKGKGALEEL